MLCRAAAGVLLTLSHGQPQERVLAGGQRSEGDAPSPSVISHASSMTRRSLTCGLIPTQALLPAPPLPGHVAFFLHQFLQEFLWPLGCGWTRGLLKVETLGLRCDCRVLLGDGRAMFLC